MSKARQKRVITESWADALCAHIVEQGRGFQAQMAEDIGCSPAIISRIKGVTIRSSEWVEVIAKYCNLPLPPLEMDSVTSEILKISSEMSDPNRRRLFRMMRAMADEDEDASNNND